jgi:hypothetical protein
MAEAQSNGERRPSRPRSESGERPPARRDADRAPSARRDDGGERPRDAERSPSTRGDDVRERRQAPEPDRREARARDEQGDRGEERGDRGDRAARDGSEQDDRRPRRRLDALAASRFALDALQSLTNRPAEGVIGVERNGDDWVVVIELVETARIPNTSDVLGEYEVQIGPDRELVSYHRRARYTRGSTQSD